MRYQPIDGTPLFPTEVRWSLARSELLYGKISRLKPSDLSRSTARKLINQTLTLWRKLLTDSSSNEGTTGLRDINKIQAQLESQQDSFSSEYWSLESDLRQVHFAVERKLASILSIKPGDVIICFERFPDSVKFNPWRIESINGLHATINRYQINEIRHLGIAWVFRPINNIESLPGDRWRYSWSLPWLDRNASNCSNIGDEETITMSLSQHCNGQELTGWIDWEIFSEAGNFYIELSNVFPPLDNIWLWMMLIGQCCIPIGVAIDTEGSIVTLRVTWLDQQTNKVRLSIQHDQDAGEISIAIVDRGYLLEIIAQTFAEFFNKHYIPRLWDYDLDRIDRPEALPWSALPHSAIPRESSSIPDQMELALTMIRLAWDSSFYRSGRNLTDMQAIGLHYLYCQRVALIWSVTAWLVAKEKLPNSWIGRIENFLPELPGHIADVVRRAFDAMVKFHAEWEANDARLAYRRPSDTDVTSITQNAIFRIADDIQSELPLQTGLWLVNFHRQWGRLLSWNERTVVIDWGEEGVERLTLCRDWLYFRYPPQTKASLCDTPLLQRWRRFATDENSDIYPVCPCCAYPSWELDPIELQFCLYCGWIGEDDFELQELDLPIKLGEHDITLRRARLNFENHGDALEAIDNGNYARLHRDPEIIAAKQNAIYAMDQWLSSEPNSIELPFREWSVLDDLIWLHRESMFSRSV